MNRDSALGSMWLLVFDKSVCEVSKVSHTRVHRSTRSIYRVAHFNPSRSPVWEIYPPRCPCAVQTRSEFYDVNYVLWMWTELHYKVHLLSIKAMWSLGSVSENGLLTKFKSIYISSACVQTTIDRSHSKSATTFMSTSLLKLKRDAKQDVVYCQAFHTAFVLYSSP